MITQIEYEWTEELIAHAGSNAIGCLIALLDSRDREVRDLSAYALTQIDGLEGRHVNSVLKAALKPEAGGALPWVLARIDSGKAVDGMVQLLRSDPVADSATAWVFHDALSSGDRLDRGINGWSAYSGISTRLVEALGRVLESPKAGDEALQRAALMILASTGKHDQILVASVVRLASDPNRSEALRLDAIAVLGIMGPSAAAAVESLEKIEASSAAELASAAGLALNGIEGPASDKSYGRSLAGLEYLSRQETLRNRVWVGGSSWGALSAITDLARYGVGGRSAPSELLRLLSESVLPDARVEAAWTLGDLGDPSVGSALLDVLDDPDWLLVAAAADSITRLKYRPATKKLEVMAKEHWYPPIRTVASRAIAALDGRSSDSPLPRSVNRSRIPWVLFAEDMLPGPASRACVDFDSESRAVRRDGFFGSRTSRVQAELHTYTLDGHFHGRGPRSARLDVVPGFGVQVEGGWLLASRRGEFGGELVFQPEGAPFQIVARGNFEDVHTMNDGRRVATEGLAHMGSDRGALFALREDGEGWSARWWRRLPGEPQASWIRRDGTLLVNASRGSVVVHPDGRMEMAACTPQKDAQPSGGNDRPIE